MNPSVRSSLRTPLSLQVVPHSAPLHPRFVASFSSSLQKNHRFLLPRSIALTRQRGHTARINSDLPPPPSDPTGICHVAFWPWPLRLLLGEPLLLHGSTICMRAVYFVKLCRGLSSSRVLVTRVGLQNRVAPAQQPAQATTYEYGGHQQVCMASFIAPVLSTSPSCPLSQSHTCVYCTGLQPV